MKYQAHGLLAIALVDNGNVWTGQVANKFLRYVVYMYNISNSHAYSIKSSSVMKCQPSGLLPLVDSGNVRTGPGVQQHVLQHEQQSQ